MHEPPDSPEELDPASRACLERTRSWVLNILVGVGLTILASGLVLRFAGWSWNVDDVEGWRRALYGGLIGVVLLSHFARRTLGSRASLRPPETRSARFFRSRVASAAVGWLAAPLGLAYGLAIEPVFESVVLFWAAALVLGILALPKPIDLQDFPDPMTPDRNAEER